MAVYGIADSSNRTVFPQGRIQVHNKLMAEHIKIDPVRGTSAFGKTQFSAIKFSSFGYVANRDGDVEGG
jgi:hypothetical protein